MKLGNYDIQGNIVKDNETYIVKDNNTLKNLVVSTTCLHPKMSTSGHKHPGQEEVYTFMFGQGEMEIDDTRFPVTAGDIVIIPDGAFHRVHNTHAVDLSFVCVFDGKRNH